MSSDVSAFYFKIVRDVLQVTGVDARKFLHSQLANDIASLSVGASQYSLLLEPTGKLTSLMRVRCNSEESFTLDCDAGFGEASAVRLARFKIRIKCEISTEAREFVAVRKISAEENAKFLADGKAMLAWREKDGAVDFFAVDFMSSGLPASVREGSLSDFELERVLASWPTMGVDMSGDSMPAETGLTDVAVSFTKGCYPGQELVERMDSRGAKAPQSLRLIRAAAGAKVGEPVVVDAIEIGLYTSVCQDFALALIKRSADSRSIEIGS